MIRSLPLAVLTRQSESQPRAALPALIRKEAGPGPPLNIFDFRRTALVQIEVVLQLHPHRNGMAILGCWYKPICLAAAIARSVKPSPKPETAWMFVTCPFDENTARSTTVPVI